MSKFSLNTLGKLLADIIILSPITWSLRKFDYILNKYEQ